MSEINAIAAWLLIGFFIAFLAVQIYFKFSVYEKSKRDDVNLNYLVFNIHHVISKYLIVGFLLSTFSFSLSQYLLGGDVTHLVVAGISLSIVSFAAGVLKGAKMMKQQSGYERAYGIEISKNDETDQQQE